jgi:hypothetical protein
MPRIHKQITTKNIDDIKVQIHQFVTGILHNEKEGKQGEEKEKKMKDTSSNCREMCKYLVTLLLEEHPSIGYEGARLRERYGCDAVRDFEYKICGLNKEDLDMISEEILTGQHD